MCVDTSATIGNTISKKLFLASLVVALFTTFTFDVVFSLFVLDIASSFNVSVGVASLLKTVVSAVAVVFTLIMSVSSIRFNHKSLLLAGVLSIAVGSVGCFLAPTFPVMVLFYSLDGVGTAVVFAMAFTMVGEVLPLKQRSGAVGLLSSTSSIAFTIAPPILGYLANIGGWRTTFMSFILPISLIGLFLSYLTLPSISHPKSEKSTMDAYIEGIKSIFSSKSATSCLIGTTLNLIAFTAIILFAIAFHRQIFSISPDFSVIVLMVNSIIMALGNVVAGFLINRFGRKNLTVLGAFIGNLSILLFMNMPTFPSALLFNYIGSFFGGVAASSAYSLMLEQVPAFRGTMMSLTSAAINLGIGLGGAIGGIIIDSLSYPYVGLCLGSIGFVAVLFYGLSTDPCKS